MVGAAAGRNLLSRDSSRVMIFLAAFARREDFKTHSTFRFEA